jgi:hypothetical protein
MGCKTKATGTNSTAMGEQTEAIGQTSTAMGRKTKASGDSSTAMGGSTEATGSNSTAMGLLSKASGEYSTAMGSKSHAKGDYSFAIHLNYDIGPEVGARTFRISSATSIGGNVGWSEYSDKRLKKDIQYLSAEDNLNKILQLNAVRFRWKDNDHLLNLGLIAQEVEEIVPESVRYDEHNDIYSMEYTALIPVLIEGMKEQQKIIEKQQEMIEELKREVDILKQK